MNGQTRAGSARLNSYHGPKQKLLGTHAGQPAPAWKTSNMPNGPAAAGGSTATKALERGSKILLSNLPLDVGQGEVEELFKRTVGPMKDVFLIYNNKGKSKGMAIVTFARPGDARIARAKYDQKIVDNRHRIKVEIITDDDERPPRVQPPAGPPSLLSRLAGPKSPSPLANAKSSAHINGVSHRPVSVPAVKALPTKKPGTAPIITVGPKRRVKKGPKRVKKTVAQLDQEMEEYRAGIIDGA
ncbi:hypothetical protein FA95DRAFT_1484246 [Auriscalpium vulgare]|uniref:Uncharacterized protein n=1 Tax=Auriscalpium vulgare TaxID=40419 RepID=A0ACB8S6U9_9AGAM|nr:hypothetical protein FA95DRAFT_1484246 [Auriscalpium vulgare]